MSLTNNHAVVLGDIVASQALPDGVRKDLYNLLDDKMADWKSDYAGLRWEPTRGDAIQCYLPHPGQALLFAVLIYSYLVGITVLQAESTQGWPQPYAPRMRLSIGIGEVEILDKDTLARSDGPAFVQAGRGLDAMPSDSHLTIHAGKGVITTCLMAIASLLEVLLKDLTPAQAAVVYLHLQGVAELQVAEKLKISQQAANKHKRAAHYDAIKTAVEAFHKIYAT